MKLTIQGKEYELKLRMLAARNYEKATGKSLYNSAAGTEIFGDDKDKKLDIDLFLQFILACVQDGLYPEKCELTIEDIASSITAFSTKDMLPIIRFFMMQKFNMTDEQIDESFEKAQEKLETEKNAKALTEVSGQS